MKKVMVLLGVLAAVVFISLNLRPALAEVTIKVNGTQVGRFETLNFPAGTAYNRTAGSAALNLNPAGVISGTAYYISGTVGATASGSSSCTIKAVVSGIVTSVTCS